MIAKIYLNRSKEYLIDKRLIDYTRFFKYLKVLKNNNETLYKNTKLQIEKSHISN